MLKRSPPLARTLAAEGRGRAARQAGAQVLRQGVREGGRKRWGWEGGSGECCLAARRRRMRHAETRGRTGDLQIFSLTLSQLSYRGSCFAPILDASLLNNGCGLLAYKPPMQFHGGRKPCANATRRRRCGGGRAPHQDKWAGRPKALDSGASPQGRGPEPRNCHVNPCWKRGLLFLCLRLRALRSPRQVAGESQGGTQGPPPARLSQGARIELKSLAEKGPRSEKPRVAGHPGGCAPMARLLAPLAAANVS